MPSIYQFINQQGYLVECINDIDPNSTNIYLLVIFPIKIKGFIWERRKTYSLWMTLVHRSMKVSSCGKMFQEHLIVLKSNLKIVFDLYILHTIV